MFKPVQRSVASLAKQSSCAYKAISLFNGVLVNSQPRSLAKVNNRFRVPTDGTNAFLFSKQGVVLSQRNPVLVPEVTVQLAHVFTSALTAAGVYFVVASFVAVKFAQQFAFLATRAPLMSRRNWGSAFIGCTFARFALTMKSVCKRSTTPKLTCWLTESTSLTNFVVNCWGKPRVTFRSFLLLILTRTKDAIAGVGRWLAVFQVPFRQWFENTATRATFSTKRFIDFRHGLPPVKAEDGGLPPVTGRIPFAPPVGGPSIILHTSPSQERR